MTRDSDGSPPRTDGRPRIRALRPELSCCLLLLAVVGFRFNRRDLLPSDSLWPDPPIGLGDAANYAAYVELFRHRGTAEAVAVPFLYRPLVPLLATLLPCPPITAIDVVNVVSLELALLAVTLRLDRRRFSIRDQWVGAILFVASFPAFYYGAIGLVDPAGLLIVAVGIVLAEQGRWIGTGIALALGALTKETTVVLIPAIAAHIWSTSSTSMKQMARLLAALTLCFSVPFLALRFAYRDVGLHMWLPEWWRIGHNLRPRAFVSTLLTFGPVGALAVYCTQKRRAIIALRGRSFFWPNAVGCLGGLALLCWSYVSAHTDGRGLWMAYPFAIPLGVAAFAELQASNVSNVLKQ